MDLHFTDDRPTEEEKAAVDGVLGAPESGWLGGARRIATEGRASSTGHAARAHRHLLLPRSSRNPLAFGLDQPRSFELCLPPAQRSAGGGFRRGRLLRPVFPAASPASGRPRLRRHCLPDARSRRALRKVGANVGAGRFRRLPTATLPGCEAPAWAFANGRPPPWSRRPASSPGKRFSPPADPAAVTTALTAANGKRPANPDEFISTVSVPQAGQPQLRLLRRVGIVDPQSLRDYRNQGGYRALEKAFELGSERVLQEVTDSKLLGRGGAAFPAGIKWRAVAEAEAPCYTICNADESEPGTFKDRVLMEADPFAVVEAMTIAGTATGCGKGFIYIRGEYPLATERIAHAIQQARTEGLLGKTVMGRGVSFDIELRRGAGAYICVGRNGLVSTPSKATAANPGNKPPYPTQAGLFGRPTLVNNVETLVNVLPIVLEGRRGLRFDRNRAIKRPKTFLRLRSRDASRNLRSRIRNDASPGHRTRRGASPAADASRPFFWGGAAGAFVSPDEIDTPLTFEGTRGHRGHPRLSRGDAFRRHGRPEKDIAAYCPILPRRVVRPMRALPRRDSAPGRAAAPARQRSSTGIGGPRAGHAEGNRPGDARRFDLRAGDIPPPAPSNRRSGSGRFSGSGRRMFVMAQPPAHGEA